jgi:hypothetical protein
MPPHPYATALTVNICQPISLDATNKSASKTYHMDRFLSTPAHDEPHVTGRSRRQHDKYLITVLDEVVTTLQGTDVPGDISATTSQS